MGDAGAPSSGLRMGTAVDSPPASSATPAASTAAPTSAAAPWSLVLDIPAAGTTFNEIEKEVLAQVLARAEGNQSRAARSLGLSESTLRSRLKRLGLKGST